MMMIMNKANEANTVGNVILPFMEFCHVRRDIASSDHVSSMFDAQIGHIHM